MPKVAHKLKSDVQETKFKVSLTRRNNLNASNILENLLFSVNVKMKECVLQTLGSTWELISAIEPRN